MLSLLDPSKLDVALELLTNLDSFDPSGIDVEVIGSNRQRVVESHG
jgi:hypothetical protein